MNTLNEYKFKTEEIVNYPVEERVIISTATTISTKRQEFSLKEKMSQLEAFRANVTVVYLQVQELENEIKDIKSYLEIK